MTRAVLLSIFLVFRLSALYGTECDSEFIDVTVADFELSDLDQVVNLSNLDQDFDFEEVRSQVQQAYEDSVIFKVFKIKDEVVAYFGLLIDQDAETIHTTELVVSYRLDREKKSAVTLKVKQELFAVLKRFKFQEIIAATYRLDVVACKELEDVGFVSLDVEIEDNEDALLYIFLAE